MVITSHLNRTQIAGPQVTLSNPSVVNPTFIVPVGTTKNEVLGFQLVVSDGQLSSMLDTVNITNASTTDGVNIASSANVTASSEDHGESQTALKAIDGIQAGYPSFSSYEWGDPGGKR